MSSTCVDAYDGGNVNGTVSGHSLSVQDAIFLFLKDSAGKDQAISIIMADKPNICDALKANREPRSATSLTFSLFNVKDGVGNLTLLAPGVGDYAVTSEPITSSGLFARASFASTNASCTSTLTNAASAGRGGLVKVTGLTRGANGSLQANLDITIGTQADALKGNVNAHFCDVDAISDNPTCE